MRSTGKVQITKFRVFIVFIYGRTYSNCNHCHSKLNEENREVVRAYFKIIRTCLYSPAEHSPEGEEMKRQHWTDIIAGSDPYICCAILLLLLSCPSDTTANSGHTPLPAL